MNDTTNIENISFKDYLADIRHDLKTPVGHILGYAEMLEEDCDPEADYDFINDLHNIMQSGERLLELINDFLGAGKSKPEDLDLKNFEYRVRVELNHIDGYSEILTETAEEDPKYADALHDIETINGSAINILDILEQKLSDLLNFNFEEIQQLDVKEIATLSEASSEKSSAPAVNDAHWNDESGQILVVDDNAENRELLRRRLEKQGYKVWLAESGPEGLKLTTEVRFDLILLDLKMPGMDGLEVLGKLKDDAILRPIPVIMISALDDTEQIVKCIMLGAEDYVFKPFNPVLLKARIHSCLEKVKLRKQQAKRMRVFVSSPGDVIPERRVVKSVLQQLNEEFSGEVHLVPVFWEEEPLVATETFQSQIIEPKDTDIYIGIFWSRLGSILPDHIRRADGSRYLSGSEYEFENAMEGFRENGKPDVVVYQKLGVPMVPLEDLDDITMRFEQKTRLEGFVEEWFKSEDGDSFIAAFHVFNDEEHFEDLLTGHMRKLLMQKIKSNADGTFG